MSMTSTKSFSTKNAGVLVVAVFSLVVSLGLSQISSAMAQNELLNCDTEGADESSNINIRMQRHVMMRFQEIQIILMTNLK